ncbi:hypothetical protein TcWFU_006314 [Taenia crassiceps]|uniref:Uncharacterized protein n=1 Tax=Taenia crassiceps TaxID=6207 RepID=A0ABR4QH14_9CEST
MPQPGPEHHPPDCKGDCGKEPHPKCSPDHHEKNPHHEGPPCGHNKPADCKKECGKKGDPKGHKPPCDHK